MVCTLGTGIVSLVRGRGCEDPLRILTILVGRIQLMKTLLTSQQTIAAEVVRLRQVADGTGATQHVESLHALPTMMAVLER